MVPESRDADVRDPDGRGRGPPRRGTRWLRIAALVAWGAILTAFWLGIRRVDAGPLDSLLAMIDQASSHPWAPAGVLTLYLLRPLLLLPITVANLAAGFVLGAVAGVGVALFGTLLSATVGYGIGRFMGSPGQVGRLAEHWPFVRLLRRRGFESVVAGGLMYLHADMVNLPAGLLRVRFPVFLMGIALGNALTLTMAVLAGASVEGALADASITMRSGYLVLAAGLLLSSLGLAYWLRRRIRPMP